MTSPIFEVLKLGLLTTIQDRGRFYNQWMGMPISGALDSFSYRIGNLLVGNEENLASLEMTVLGPSLRLLQDTWIAITGANLSPIRNGSPIPMWTSIKVQQGDVISFGSLKEGCRGYLSVRGGISVPLVMGSRSTNLRLKLGGKEGRALQTGDLIESESFEDGNKFRERTLPPEMTPRYPSELTLRVILGPQTRYFERDIGIKTFLQSQYIVTAHADRMGYRLEGPIISFKHGVPKSIPSEASTPGGVQIPEGGKPIILLVEQNGGGYVKIATVISSDMDKLAQSKPGDKIRFQKISVAEAHLILRQRENIFQRWKEGLNSLHSFGSIV